MTYSIIQKSQLEGANRIDAEYYQLEYLKLINKIKQTKTYKSWNEINGQFITGPFGLEFNVENYVTDTKYRYVRGKDVKGFFLQDNDNVYIPEKDFGRLKKYSLNQGDILLSVVGTLGNSSIVDDLTLPSIFSCKSTVFRSTSINPYYFIAFLNSKYGRDLLIRCGRGHVQIGLNIEDIKSLLIYIPSEKEQESIASIITESKQLLENSKIFYSQAEDLFLEELGLNDFKFSDDLSYTVNFSEIQLADRMDAEYFQPKYEKILQQISKVEIKPLSSLFTIIRGKNFQYKDGDIRVIQTRQLGKQYIDFETEKYTSGEIAKREKLEIIKDQDVLFASMGVGSLGKTNIYYDLDSNKKQYTIDSTLRIFRSKTREYFSEVLVVYLDSFVGQELIYKYIVGSSGIISIYDKYLDNFPVPKLTISAQQKIAELVRKSHGARKKSKELLEEAKRKVEEMIEKGDN